MMRNFTVRSSQNGAAPVWPRRFITPLLLAAAFVLFAQDSPLRADHPERYVVEKGDTLWDLAARFLRHPWEWPAIWQVNPQIANPHLIYPGDVISLVYVGGEPRLALSPGETRLAPRIRELPADEAIPTVPLDAIEHFLRYPRVIDEASYEALPYIVENAERRTYAGIGDKTYARGLVAADGDEVVIARTNFTYRDRFTDEGGRRHRESKARDLPRWRSAPHDESERPMVWRWAQSIGGMRGKVIGVELWEISRARVAKSGEISTLEILSGRREVRAGDRILPVEHFTYDVHFLPRAPDHVPERARILALDDRHEYAGQPNIAALNVGLSEGIEPGHTFAVFQPGEKIQDNVDPPLIPIRGVTGAVTLPAEYEAQIMVFRSFEHVSYGLVMGGGKEIQEGDQLRHPAARL